MVVAGADVWHWSRCGRLCVDEEGLLWRWLDRPGPAGWLYLGPVDDPEVPDELVQAALELIDLWRDCHGGVLAPAARL